MVNDAVSKARNGQAIAGLSDRVPPHLYFLVSAVFHYLGPAFAVLLFRHVESLGVAWLRIAAAGLVFAVWRRPWRLFRRASRVELALLLSMGAVLAIMNSVFYLALERLPLATVSALEFAGPIVLAAIGARSARNFAAIVVVVCGVALLTQVQWVVEPLGLGFAFANCVLFMAYIVLGHKMAEHGGAGGVDRLAAAMLVAMVVACPIGLSQALPAFTDLQLLAAGIGVGICSSVIPYVCDQLAMARLSRSTFSLLLSLLPATAAVIGVAVLGQVLSLSEITGVALVICGVALHQAP